MALIRNLHNKEKTDQELINNYKSSEDLAVLGSLYNRYIDLIFGVCMKYYKDEEKSKDGVMEIFESLVVKVKKHEIGYFKGWLYTVVRNHCLEKIRKNSKTLTVELSNNNVYSEGVFHPEYDDEKEQTFIALEKCMEQLPEMQRKCVDFFYLKKKSYNEIAEELSIKWSRIRSYIQNGRRNLKTCMETKNEQRVQ